MTKKNGYEIWYLEWRAGALGLVTNEIQKYRLDLVGVQEVRWGGSVTLESGNYALFYFNHQLGTRFLLIGK